MLPNLPIVPRMTTVCAEQGTARMVMVARMSRSRFDSMTLVASIAGTLHPVPTIIGMMARPCRPNLCMTPSSSMTTRGR